MANHNHVLRTISKNAARGEEELLLNKKKEVLIKLFSGYGAAAAAKSRRENPRKRKEYFSYFTFYQKEWQWQFSKVMHGLYVNTSKKRKGKYNM